MVIKSKAKKKNKLDGVGKDNKNNLIGQFVLYKKLSQIAKIISYDRASDSYTIECNGRVINTIEEYLDFDFSNKIMKTIELEVYSKELKTERDEWMKYAESLEKKLKPNTTDKNETDYKKQIESLTKDRDDFLRYIFILKEKITKLEISCKREIKDYEYYKLLAEEEREFIKSHREEDIKFLRGNDAPKRQKSAWDFFRIDNHLEIKQNNPGISGYKIIRLLASKWLLLKFRHKMNDDSVLQKVLNASKIAENDTEYIAESVKIGKYTDPYLLLDQEKELEIDLEHYITWLKTKITLLERYISR